MPLTKPDTKYQEQARSGFAALIHNRHFMSLWIAQIFSQLADRAVFVLFVAILTSRQTTTATASYWGAAQTTSMLYVAFTIPAIILSPLAGVFVDRLSNKSVLTLSNIARGGFISLLSLPFIMKIPMFAYMLAFIISIGSQFFGPAETSFIPRIVKKEDLYAANSLFFTTMMIALAFGFAAGEPIVSRFGLYSAHWAVAASFFLAAILSATLPGNKPGSNRDEPWWEELRFGLAYISANPQVFRAIIKITFLFSTIITLNIIAVGLSQQVLHMQPFQFGYIVAAAGFGMGLGNFWIAHYGQKLHPPLLAYIGFSSLGLFMILLASLQFISPILATVFNCPSFAWQGLMLSVPLLLAMLVGVSCAMVAVPTQAQLQAVVAEDLRGKVFAAQNTAMSAASTIPVILAGILTDNLPGGVSSTLLIIGSPTFLIGSYHLFRTIRKQE